MIFYNEAAGALLGTRFEERGTMSACEWSREFGPFGDDGEPIPIEKQPLTVALRANRPAHARHQIRSLDGEQHDVEVSGLPVIGVDGFQGAMVFFWVAAEAGS